MSTLRIVVALAAMFAVLPVHAADKPASAPAAVKLPAQAPDVAAPKMDPKTGEPQAGFMQSHQNFLKIAKQGEAQLVFLGDSITAGWNGKAAKPIWDAAFGKYKPANFGIGGDRTQHVLWRIANGELEGIKAKAVVIMIGTNNSGGDPAEAIAKGVTKIVETVRAKQPQAKVLLLAIFPRGSKPDGKLTAQNEKLKQVNAIICKLADNKNIFFMDIGSKFVQEPGPIDKEIMPDFLHLSGKGYQIWADAISPKLAELMK